MRNTKKPPKTVSTKVIITFLSLILTLKNFLFNFRLYLQITISAMGIICVPFYANIFMVSFEAKHIYPFIKEMSLLYLRYIEDIFMISKGTKVELMTFIKGPSEKQNYQIWLSNFTKKNYISWHNAIRRWKWQHSNNFILQTCRWTSILHAESENPISLTNSIF